MDDSRVLKWNSSGCCSMKLVVACACSPAQLLTELSAQRRSRRAVHLRKTECYKQPCPECLDIHAGARDSQGGKSASRGAHLPMCCRLVQAGMLCSAAQASIQAAWQHVTAGASHYHVIS